MKYFKKKKLKKLRIRLAGLLAEQREYSKSSYCRPDNALRIGETEEEIRQLESALANN
jgi:hypothetical protein